MRECEEILSEAQMQALLEKSQTQPIFLFKYSPTCGISQVAQEAWSAWLQAPAPEGLTLAQVDVLEAKPAARGISQWIHVLHQSPQLLVLDKGQCVAHTSHYSITVDWLNKTAASALEA